MTTETTFNASLVELRGRVRGRLPWVRTLSNKVANVHGARDPELVEMDRLLSELAMVAEEHLEVEEELLMPALRDDAPAAAPDGRELADLADAHLELARLLEELRVAANHFRNPDWACLTYRRLMEELQQLETELLRCIHLEHHAAIGLVASPAAAMETR